ncbi:MAG: molybdopterin-dependent oxidoreductase [Polynucleobacter sp.]|nr:molybdopterin-dependent oxidoreductase [Polynucleobacter sp.]
MTTTTQNNQVVENASRRRFIIDTSVVGSGLILGIGSFSASATPHNPNTMMSATSPEVNAWVNIKPDDTVVIRIVRSEMGQGTRTGLAQLVAEELECNWKKIITESPTPGQSLSRKRVWGEFSTGGSRGIRISEDYVRRGAAGARIMLVQAAANQWNVSPSELSVDKGIISHKASGRKISYGKVAEAAAKLTPPDPKSIQLKNPKDWKVAGKPLARLDTFDKVNGTKIYGTDLQLPGMLCAAIKQSPVFGGKVKSFDANKVKNFRGVKAAVQVGDNAVAVVADTWWRAKVALDSLPIEWDEMGNGAISSVEIKKQMEEGLQAVGDFWGRKEGDAPAVIKASNKIVEAIYSTPFQAHATMEPMNATARYTNEKAEAWVPTQNGEASHATLAEASGLPLNQCEIYKLDPGMGLGRRGGTQEYVAQAIRIAKQFPGIPIKMIWSREEDMTHDYYHPTAMAKMQAGLDSNGNITGIHIKTSGPSINATLNPMAIKNGKDNRQLQGFDEAVAPVGAQLGYTFPNLLTEYVMRNSHVPVGPWRGVNTNQNGLFMECFIEECARAAGKDSVAFRQVLMKNHPKHLGVLNAAAKKANWSKPLPRGVHRGVAQFMGYGSYSACVAEVSVTGGSLVKIKRLVFALDCGHVVNPYLVREQIEGSVVMALGAIFNQEITVENGRIKQQNFDSYPLLKLAQVPKVESVLVPTMDFWGGVGEPTICVVGPAIINAISAALGKPLRNFPLVNEGLTIA